MDYNGQVISWHSLAWPLDVDQHDGCFKFGNYLTAYCIVYWHDVNKYFFPYQVILVCSVAIDSWFSYLQKGWIYYLASQLLHYKVYIAILRENLNVFLESKIK